MLRLRQLLKVFVFAALISVLDAGVALAKPLLSVSLSKLERDWLASHPVIRLGYDGYFPPYSFINDHGELEGFAVDVFDLIEKQLDIEFEIYPESTWYSLYEAAQHRKLDVVATMVGRQDRRQWFNFTVPYIDKKLIVLTRVEDTHINRREQLAGNTLALVKSYEYVSRVLREFPTAKPLYVDTILDGLTAVSVGDADATITYLGAAHYYRTKYLFSNLKYAAAYEKTGSAESMGIRSDWPELLSILDKALGSISTNKMLSLLEKWLPIDYMESLVEVDLTEKEKAWIAQHKNIRVGIDPEFAPFEYMDDGKYSGMASDYLKILSERLQLKMTVVPGLPWDEVMTRVKQRDIDVLPAVGRTEDRADYLTYTAPYLNFYRVIVTRTNAPLILGIDDIKTMRVAVQANSSHHGYLLEQTAIEPITFSTLQDAILSVSSGQADAFVGNVAAASYWIHKYNLTNLKVAAPVSQSTQSLHFAVRNDWPELAVILQKGLDSIGPYTRNRISKTWLTLEYNPMLSYKGVWKIVVLFSAALGVVVLWNVLLNWRVHTRTSQLLYSAHYDKLTDLPNRFLILDRLLQRINEARRNPKKLALISVDLDDFKKINDSLGHEAGDLLLKDVAVRLKQSLRVSDTLGRLGGDQFLIVLSQIADTVDAAKVARTLLQCFDNAFLVDNRNIIVTASLGISVFPRDGDAPEILLKNADTATHHAKKYGLGNYTFYTKSLNLKVSRQLRLEECMQNALQKGEFCVHYQTKVDAKTKRIVSFEALLRWHNDQLGNVSPVEFIPIAEKNGLIESIGIFVLKAALDALAKWQLQYDSALTMAVNLSPTQFRSSVLIDQVRDAIDSVGVPSHSLELEITEGTLMGGYKNADAILRSFESMGIKLAMDDYGTGYSSLSNLRKYKFNCLKIDREFISDLSYSVPDRQLVATTITMAHNLGMKVVAEGVETEEQCVFLVAHDCDILQGWLFSKPMPFESVNTLLEGLRFNQPGSH